MTCLKTSITKNNIRKLNETNGICITYDGICRPRLQQVIV